MKIPGTYKEARIWWGTIPGTNEPGFVEHRIVEEPVSDELRRIVGEKDELHVFRMGECAIILGREPQGIHGERRWHLSISCVDRHPSWDEIKTARYRLLGPDTVMAMILPPSEEYVNVPAQDHVFQLWEIEDAAEIWAVNYGAGDS